MAEPSLAQALAQKVPGRKTTARASAKRIFHTQYTNSVAISRLSSNGNGSSRTHESVNSGSGLEVRLDSEWRKRREIRNRRSVTKCRNAPYRQCFSDRFHRRRQHRNYVQREPSTMCQRRLHERRVHCRHRLAAILIMMRFGRARHRLAALHCLLRRSHRVTIENIRSQQKRRSHEQDDSYKSHPNQINRHD